MRLRTFSDGYDTTTTTRYTAITVHKTTIERFPENNYYYDYGHQLCLLFFSQSDTLAKSNSTCDDGIPELTALDRKLEGKVILDRRLRLGSGTYQS